MSKTLTANFETRRDAEMTVERLVQEQGLDRAAISIKAEGVENSAGEDVAGGDRGAPGSDAEPALNGEITVSVRLDDDADAEAVEAAFAEYGGD